MPYMKTTEDGRKVRDYDKEISWGKDRYRILGVRITRDYDIMLKEIIEQKNISMTAWVKDMIEKEHAKIKEPAGV